MPGQGWRLPSPSASPGRCAVPPQWRWGLRAGGCCAASCSVAPPGLCSAVSWGVRGLELVPLPLQHPYSILLGGAGTGWQRGAGGGGIPTCARLGGPPGWGVLVVGGSWVTIADGMRSVMSARRSGHAKLLAQAGAGAGVGCPPRQSPQPGVGPGAPSLPSAAVAGSGEELRGERSGMGLAHGHRGGHRVPPAGRWALCTARPLSAAMTPCPTPGPGLGAGDEHSRHTVAPRSCTMVLGSCGRGRDAGVRQCSRGDLGDPGAGGCDPADLQPHPHFSAFLPPAGRAGQQMTALRVALAGT